MDLTAASMHIDPEGVARVSTKAFACSGVAWEKAELYVREVLPWVRSRVGLVVDTGREAVAEDTHIEVVPGGHADLLLGPDAKIQQDLVDRLSGALRQGDPGRTRPRLTHRVGSIEKDHHTSRVLAGKRSAVHGRSLQSA